MNAIYEQLKYTIEILEGRIKLLDTKASILIALQTGLFAMVTFLLKEIFLKNYIKLESYILIFILAITTAIIIALLLQTIRPTKNYFSKSTGLKNKLPETKNVMWPEKCKKPNKELFLKKINNCKESDLEEEIKVSLLVRHHLVYRKYRTYEWALLITKYQIIFTFAYIIFLLMKLINSL